MPRPSTIQLRTKSGARPSSVASTLDDYGLASHLSLSKSEREPHDPSALGRWSERLGVEARRAFWLAARLEALRVDDGGARLRKFLTGNRSPNALDVSPTPWLRMTETQITRPMADFLNEGGPRRIMAFLRALPCAGVVLPDAFDSGGASAEVAAIGGRVDLLVTGRRGRRTYGAAVEVKIDHKLHNPLGSYARLAAEEGLAVAGRSEGRATGALIVLARSSSEATRKRLSRNRGWRFVHWSGFLRRFERELVSVPDNDDFRAFRRMVWDRFI